MVKDRQIHTYPDLKKRLAKARKHLDAIDEKIKADNDPAAIKELARTVDYLGFVLDDVLAVLYQRRLLKE
jgi:hypothetical protein|tara:strand:- start:20459 stop:20668 length:210 start_codon:yes stop_codon:yes gene_type:complete